MKRLIDGSMHRAFLIVTFVVLLIVWGGMSALQIQRDYLPQINNSTLTVTVQAENYQASEIKAKITKPIEQSVRVVDGLQDVETTSFNGGSLIRLNFPMSYNMEKAETQVSKALEGISLPAGVQKPLVSQLSTNSLPMMRMSLKSSSENISENILRTAIQLDIVNELKTVPGVKDVVVTGGGSAGYAVTIRMMDLKKFELTVDDVKRSLEENFTTGMEGTISNQQVSFPIQVSGWGLNQQDLTQLPIHLQDGKTIPLSDIADITHSIVNLQTISRTNGTPSVLLDVMKTPSSNITEVSERIRSKIKDIPEIKNKDVKLSILLDQGKQVNSSLKGLIKEGLLGCVFSMICVFLFFRKVRSTLLIAISLPICLLVTTGILKMMGISLNILTVSGLIVAMGRVVDDSIVILDNMNRKAHEKRGKFSLIQLSQAVTEMIPAIVSSTATTVAVYIPIALLGGMVSSAFSGFAWSVVIALILSLFVSILVVPALYNLFWKGQPISVNDHLEPLSQKILAWVFQRKKIVVVSFLSLFLITAASAVFLPVNFLPMTNNKGQISVQVEMPSSAPLKEVDTEVKRLETLLKTNQKVNEFSSSLGSTFTPQSDDVFDVGGGWIQKPNVANLSIQVKPGTDVNTLILELQNQFNSLSSKAIYTVTNQSISGDDSQLKINLTGSDSHTLEYMAGTIANQLTSVTGLSVQGLAEHEDNVTQYNIKLNRKDIEMNGLKVDDILNRIQLYMAEGLIGSISLDNNIYPIVFHSDLQKYSKQQSGRNITSKDPSQDIFTMIGRETFKNNKGKEVPLNQLATLVPNSDPSVIQEKDGLPFAVVTANITSSDIEKVTKEVKSELRNIPLPVGVKYSFAGAPEQVNQMIYEMSIALFFSILLVLLIISAVFRGWKAPLSVLMCIPLAFSGSVIGMFIFHKQWNLAALVGLLMLTGIVVTNGIVLVDKIERNIAGGMEHEEAIFQGTLSRVRPILTTALTTILTLLPLALSSSNDTVISQTLGIVVVGGLISSTITGILIIPIIYRWMNRERTASFTRPSVKGLRFRKVKLKTFYK
ncbi:acriflavine resistance protein B [Bacillus sp. MUM 116]|uniref:efflux RND transporter permease subunit n=1 Tax=Bacillus sp. MUM 116 TaxID=1678002 RepID=UPI0008F55CA9|nr:efflux RND transporter permease subunit [Bacillus sp. MUM 116]OIK10856.1 acriflavine resistance protein B [Bacillus sp. MUM 116]